MQIAFAIQSYRSPSLPLSAQRVVNLYAEKQPQGAKSQVAVFGAPGIATYATVGSGPIRGMHFLPSAGLLYVVSGRYLYSVSGDATPVVTLLGGEISGSGVVSMADNGDQLCIVNGTSGYIYTTDAGFQLITDGDFNAANTVDYLDGFFIFDHINTNQWFRSDLLDGTSYDGLAFASAESNSDNVIAVRKHKQLAYIFGGLTIEPWQNAGAANFPWQRISGGTIDRGIIGAQAIAQEDESLFLLGEDRVAYRLGGTSLSRISGHAHEAEWQKYATVSDAFGFAYTFNGHKFITFTFPTQSATWSYDIATQLWHERESRDQNGVALGRWRVNCSVVAFGKTIFGDVFSGKIGYADPTVMTEFGDQIYGEAVGTPGHADGKRVFVSEFRLDMETGVGLTSGQGSDPQVMLDVSRDGGHTWDEPQEWRSLGKIGEYQTQLFWTRLGQAYQWLPRITISDPVRRTIIAATANMKAGV